MESSFEFEAGILICGRIRDMLDDEIFNGRKIRYREGRGWISRVFSIKGERADVEAVSERLTFYAKCLDSA